jgi:hypothetical protein
MPPTREEVLATVQDSLEDDIYACSSLVPLSGGTANFVFQGSLKVPLKDGTKIVVVKHTPPYVASNPAFGLTDDRSVNIPFPPQWSPTDVCQRYEAIILKDLGRLPPFTWENITVDTPKIYGFTEKNNTQIQEYFPNSRNLKSYLQTWALLPGSAAKWSPKLSYHVVMLLIQSNVFVLGKPLVSGAYSECSTHFERLKLFRIWSNWQTGL